MTNCGNSVERMVLPFCLSKKPNKIKLRERSSFYSVMYVGKHWSSFMCKILLIPNADMIRMVIIARD